MKPQNIMLDGRTEASALLFVHDSKRAQETLLDSSTRDKLSIKGGMIEKNHKEFIDYVIREWISEMTTETSVTLEFMNQSERDSITSSICNFA